VYLYVLWLCMRIIRDVFTVFNALLSGNNVLKSRGASYDCFDILK